MTKLIAGLGNPGAAYRNTRHNLGFDVLDAVAARLHCAFDRQKQDGLIAEAVHAGQKLLLVKPQTYMNRSGDCVAALARHKAPDPADVLVVVDDVALPLGRIRLRAGGSAGGHNGLKSVIERMGTDAFPRLRMGVGDDRQGRDLADHVLSRFRPEEYQPLEAMIARGVDAVLCWATAGIERAMSEYNQ
jgi:PTH1 family peptidyl-tRNA hydrolase